MLSRFVDYMTIERRSSEHTVLAYEHDIREFADFMGLDAEELNMDSIDHNDIRLWMVSLMDNGITARSVKRKLSSLKTYSKYCLRVGLTEKDPTQKVIAPKMDKPLPVFYKESEMEALRQTEQWADDFESIRDNLILEMFYQTGMRRAELIGLDDKDVDLKSMQIRVFGKRRKERLVPIGDSLAAQIAVYLTARDEQTGGMQEGFFCTKKGKRMSADNVYKVVKNRMSEVSTLKKQSPHVLRHTFATTMLNHGADINTIKTLMGHASLDATQIYTHTTFEQIKRVYSESHPREKKADN